MDGAPLWTSTYPGAAQPNGVVVVGPSVYAVGSESGVGQGQFGWHIQSIDATSGQIQWWESIDISTGDLGYNDAAIAVAADATGIYVGGFATHDAFSIYDQSWVVGAWSSAQANLWLVDENLTGGEDRVEGVAVDAQAVYVVGRAGAWRVEKRAKLDGHLGP